VTPSTRGRRPCPVAASGMHSTLANRRARRRELVVHQGARRYLAERVSIARGRPEEIGVLEWRQQMLGRALGFSPPYGSRPGLPTKGAPEPPV
jgi:hypothetical protein